MRPEKQYLVEEVNNHLNKSDYVYLTNYERITVEEIAELRAQLPSTKLSSTLSKTASSVSLRRLKNCPIWASTLPDRLQSL